MKKKPGKIIKHMAAAAVCLLLLVSGTWAWIYGNTSPKLSGKFTIGDTQGLNFILNSKSVKLINLNSVFGIESESLNLNEVTSADGETFLARDTQYMYLESGNPGTAGEILTFRPAVNNSTAGQEGAETFSGDYLDMSFNLNLEYGDLDEEENAEYYIYFLNGKIKDEAYSTGFSRDESAENSGAETTEKGLRALRTCLRVSGASGYSVKTAGSTDYVMEYDSDTKEYYAFFGNYPELGTEAYPYRTSAVASTEQRTLISTQDSTSREEDIAGNYYISYLSEISSWPHEFGSTKEDVRVLSFDSCSIDPSTAGSRGASAPSGNYLFRMDKDNHDVTVKLRVWLEGGSEYCANSQVMPNDCIDLDMYFVAYKVTDSTAEEENYITIDGTDYAVPDGYTLLEYAESSGNAYVDTGIVGSKNISVEFKFSYYTATTVTGSGRVFGSRQTSTENSFAFGSNSNRVTVGDTFYAGIGSPNSASSGSLALNTEYKVTMSSANGTYINDTIKVSDPYTGADFTTPGNLKIFGFDTEGAVYCSYSRFYYVKLWYDNAPVRILIPAKRNSDSVVGMYDFVSNTFFAPAAGTLTAGPEVEY